MKIIGITVLMILVLAFGVFAFFDKPVYIIGSQNITGSVTDFFVNLFVGSITETIDPSSFVIDGGDVFINDSLGVEGNVYTDSMIIGVNNQSVNFLSNGDIEFKLT